MAKDYYSILGVKRDSNTDEIKKAYKNLAKKYHPDLNKSADAESKFKEINEAAATLCNEKKREHYDKFGTTDESASDGFDPRNFGSDFDFGDIFGEMFNFGQGFGRRHSRSRGSDLIAEIVVTLEEAAQGVKKTIHHRKLSVCEHCKGRGSSDQDDLKQCSICNGTGVFKQTRRTPFGVFATQAPCKDCNGQGEVLANPCKHCDGEGRIMSNSAIDIKVPPGVEDGMKLRFSGEGEAGERGTNSGDLYIVVHIKPHDIFTRDGDDLLIEFPIPFIVAAIGGEVTVPIISGNHSLKIPEGTQDGAELTIKGKGMPAVHHSQHGDEIVTIRIEVPTKLSKKQVELLKEFEKESSRKKKWFSFG